MLQTGGENSEAISEILSLSNVHHRRFSYVVRERGACR